MRHDFALSLDMRFSEARLFTLMLMLIFKEILFVGTPYLAKNKTRTGGDLNGRKSSASNHSCNNNNNNNNITNKSKSGQQRNHVTASQKKTSKEAVKAINDAIKNETNPEG